MKFWWVYGQMKEIILAISSLIFSIECGCVSLIIPCEVIGFTVETHLFLGSLDIWPILLDVDPSPQDPRVMAAMDKFTRTTEILWRERDGMATL